MKRTHVFRTLLISSLISHLLSLPYLSSAAVTKNTAQNPFPLPPFTFVGRVVDYAHVAFDADQKVEIRVLDKDGKLIVKGETFTGGNSVYNFSVDVPLTDVEDVPGYVNTGAKVTIVFVDPDGVIYANLVADVKGEKSVTVGNPGELKTLDVVLGTDSNHDGVPDEYVEDLAYLLSRKGYKKDDYKAYGDLDNDGANNYEEYVAGTNPLDPKDRFSVREMAVEVGREDYLRFKFLAARGRSYTVDTTEELKDAVWRQAAFVDGADGVEKTRLNTSAEEPADYREIYVLKENVKQQFWKMKVE